MIKGCSKKIYHIKNINGKYFEEAYFLLKSDDTFSSSPTSSATLAEEAERIIREVAASYKGSRKIKHTPISRALAFAMGAFSASSIIGIVALLASL